MFYLLKTKPNIQLWKDMGGGKESDRVKVELLPPNYSLFYHQSGQAILLKLSNALMFFSLKTKTNYLRRKRSIGAQVFVVLPSIRFGIFANVFERVQV